jgi:hypothetical protein
VPSLDDTIRLLLSRPREAGTTDAAAARALVTEFLRGIGYTVTEQRFTFRPSGLSGFPLFGTGVGALALLLFPLLVVPTVPAWSALALFGGGLATLVLLAGGVGLGWIPLGDDSREDANLIATRPGATVTRWIVAHLDTKAQVQSMAGRLVAVWILLIAIVATGALATLRLRAPISVGAGGSAAAVAVLAGALAGRGRLRGASRGARDNGSGVAAVLAAAEHCHDPGTGFLLSGAEEFGLVGARIFARLEAARLRSAVAVNLDTIDEEGTLYLVAHDRSGTDLAGREASRLAGAGLASRTRRLPLGILVDSLPLARAGVPAITIGRLTWRTLRLIHTPRDHPEGLTLSTARRIGRALAN